MRVQSLSAALLLPLTAMAQQTAWGQCGGIGWTGATTCVTGYTCSVLNPYYSQCIPSSSSVSTTASTSKSSTTIRSSTTSASPSPTKSSVTIPPTTTTKTTTASTTISGSIGPGTTLQANYYWIRAVESPNFHMYLQTDPEYTTGTAILDSYTTAGQFNIVNGQLVELINPTTGALLYANVEQQTNSNMTKLAMTFETTPNTYGTFMFSGDAVEWSVPSINRQNDAAWLVCANQQLFINLGAYDYDTPAGCADETIHYYNGATAVD